ncbi:MAG: tRNA pseudouridine(55) synthase TruB [Ruminococcaceae bacterium]|nr:tRNA pseudouridine(55) synthase TruB [Oscillospiraceae bacterium]
MDGIINVNKPLGITSHDVVYRLRKILGIKKIGHTGTLDPDAEGVLPMCIGRGTKLAEELTAKEKQYLAELTLGITTDTQDISGTILDTKAVVSTKEEIENAIMSFVGEIDQIPPMFSAIKVDGKKLYELAREGKTIEMPPRRVEVFSIEILDIDTESKKARFLVDCSKGTYIRTLCHDIGKKLGCGGVMSALKRTRSGDFRIENAYTLDEISKMAEENDFSFMTGIDEVLAHYDKVILADRNATRMCNGITISVAGIENGKTFRAYNEQGKFLALCTMENGKVNVVRSFYGEAPK